MKLKHTLILGSLLFVSVSAIAQDKKTPAKTTPAKSTPAKTTPAKSEKPSEADTKAAAAAAEKAWMDYMMPGEMHKRLTADVGEWAESITFWTAPGQPPTTVEATFTCNYIYDGRYLECNHVGVMMGMPFEGRSTVGYNNLTKMYESLWMDNMSTGIMLMKGKYDEQSSAINYKGMGVDPVAGKEIPVREVFKIVDENTRLMEMYETKNGKEFKSMEIKMSRK